MDPSGIRIGTPALTTRGMGVEQMEQVGQWILKALKSAGDKQALARIREEVLSLCQHYPVPAMAVTV
jgi:glycine hydroxymethyltransferase